MRAHPVKKGIVKAVCVSTVSVQSVRGRVRSVLELGKAKRQPFYRARFVQRGAASSALKWERDSAGAFAGAR